MFIKFSSIADDSLPSQWIVEGPPLIFSWVANKDILLSMRTEALALVLLYVDICSTPKYPQMRHIGLLTIKVSIRNVSIKCSYG